MHDSQALNIIMMSAICLSRDVTVSEEYLVSVTAGLLGKFNVSRVSVQVACGPRVLFQVEETYFQV